jgi:hypothetical protein
VGNDAKVKTGPAGDGSQSSPNPALYVAEMVVSPMTLNLNGEELEGAGIVLSPSMDGDNDPSEAGRRGDGIISQNGDDQE